VIANRRTQTGRDGTIEQVSLVAPSPRDGSDPVPGDRLPGDSVPTLSTALSETAQLATFQAVLGQSPIGAGVFDRECRYVLVNDALQKIIGLPAHELIGRRVDEVLGPLGERVAVNLRTAMTRGVPLVNQEFIGSTYAHGREPRAFLASYFSLADEEGELFGAGSLVTDVTEQRRIREELTAANERLSLLSRVSAALASCLNVHDALSALAELVVPAFADHCVVDLIDEDGGAIRRVALVHADGLAPEREAWATPGQLVTYPTDHPAVAAMRGGRAIVEYAADDPDFQHIAPTPESAEFGRRIGIRSAMTAPLVARGDVLGAVSFVTSASGRVFREIDVELGEELASRAAIALDNARLYAREQRIALTLQRSLLPERLPATPALQTAAVYHPAAQDGSVGGDWYDVIPLSCGRVALVMGDVMGRGVHAAALMGQLRAAVRAYAAQDLPPGELLGHLDGLVRGLADDTLVTCVYAVYDPVEEALCFANAGHLPPLLRTPDGVQMLDVGGVVLGAGQLPYEQSEVAFPADAVLALYTDGLVERRTADIESGIDDLRRLLAAARGDLEGISTDLVAAFAAGTDDVDDVALMLVSPHPELRPRVARLDVVPHAAKVRDIRRFALDALTEWGDLEHVGDPVQLIVSELVTNVIRHASGHEATVRIERHDHCIVVAVVDPDATPPRVTRSAPDDEGGRGLHLVDAVADRWGTRHLASGGKVVWCEITTMRDA
jgi:PAS domain S-box-containing protein